MNINDFDFSEWYENHYSVINASANPSSRAFKYMHKSLESKFKTNSGFDILEIGANIGEHINFVSKDFNSYTLTDIRPINFSDSENPRIRFKVADVEKLPFDDCTFDRVISTCVFHHLNNPAKGLQELRRVVRVGGHISILVPNDPGIAYRALRGMTTLRAAKRRGLLSEVQLVHALEHKNHYLAIKTLISWVYGDDKVQLSFRPFRFPSYNLNAMTIVRVTRLN